MVLVTDHERRIAYANDAFFRMFGYSASESIGRLPSELLAGRYTDQATLDRLRHQIELGNDVEEEILVYTKGGNEVWISAAISAVGDGQGKIKNLVMLLTDITESKQLLSLQRQVLEALALEMPIRDVFEMLCRRVETISPDVVSSVLQVDTDGLIRPLAGPSLPVGYCEALDGLAIGPEVGSWRSRRDPRRPRSGARHRHRSALAALQGGAARGRPAGLLVFADQGEGRPRDRNLRVLFQGAARAQPPASEDHRRLRSPRRAGHREGGIPQTRSRASPITTC